MENQNIELENILLGLIGKADPKFANQNPIIEKATNEFKIGGRISQVGTILESRIGELLDELEVLNDWQPKYTDINNRINDLKPILDVYRNNFLGSEDLTQLGQDLIQRIEDRIKYIQNELEDQDSPQFKQRIIDLNYISDILTGSIEFE